MTFLADLRSLVECESPSEDLAACRKVVDLAVHIANVHLSPSATSVVENGRPVFWWGSKSPKIILLAHLDTVWPIGSFQPLWIIDGDRISGPGIFDMKAGFLQAVYALEQVPDCEDQVALIATTDEELGSQTSRDLIMRLAKNADAVLVLEASLDGKVKTGRKGTAMFQVVVKGRAAHSGLEPEKGINATTEIAGLVDQIVALENPDFGTTVVPTVLKSGTTTNTVPALATLDLDIRSFNGDEMVRVETALRQLTTRHPQAEITITGGINRPPLELKSTKALYEKLEQVAATLNIEPLGHASVGGASDGNFAAAAGAPTLDGLGAVGYGAHAPGEYVLQSSFINRVELLAAFIKELIS